VVVDIRHISSVAGGRHSIAGRLVFFSGSTGRAFVRPSHRPDGEGPE
jgi:hypothetical protein